MHARSTIDMKSHAAFSDWGIGSEWDLMSLRRDVILCLIEEAGVCLSRTIGKSMQTGFNCLELNGKWMWAVVSKAVGMGRI